MRVVTVWQVSVSFHTITRISRLHCRIIPSHLQPGIKYIASGGGVHVFASRDTSQRAAFCTKMQPRPDRLPQTLRSSKHKKETAFCLYNKCRSVSSTAAPQIRLLCCARSSLCCNRCLSSAPKNEKRGICWCLIQRPHLPTETVHSKTHKERSCVSV